MQQQCSLRFLLVSVQRTYLIRTKSLFVKLKLRFCQSKETSTPPLLISQSVVTHTQIAGYYHFFSRKIQQQIQSDSQPCLTLQSNFHCFATTTFMSRNEIMIMTPEPEQRKDEIMIRSRSGTSIQHIQLQATSKELIGSTNVIPLRSRFESLP